MRDASFLRSIFTVLLLAGAAMAVLGLLRVPFARRFWRRAQWVAWAYIGVMVTLALVRIVMEWR
jgi:uncharacterized membrane protein YcjF (UPF0283 family)